MKGRHAATTIVLLVLALGGTLADHHVEHHDNEDDHSHDHDFDGDFDGIDQRLDELTARFIALEHAIDHRVDPKRIQKARSLRARVVKFEGNGCDSNDFQCGGTDPQCVGNLLVCDGVRDCRNGADENNCEVPVKNGDHFAGPMIFDHCTKRQPKAMEFVITEVHHSNAFNSALRVKANMVVNYDNDRLEGHVAFPVVGLYKQGERKLVFPAPEKDRLYVVCRFDGYNVDQCEGSIVRESGETCAKVIFNRQPCSR